MAYVAIVGVVSESFGDGCLWRGFWKSFGDLLGDVWGRLGASRGFLGSLLGPVGALCWEHPVLCQEPAPDWLPGASKSHSRPLK